MQNIDFSFGKCKTKAAYSAKLRKQAKLNLQKIKEKFTVILETPILLVIKIEKMEIIVHNYGEIFFKISDVEDTTYLEKIAKEIYEVGMN